MSKNLVTLGPSGTFSHRAAQYLLPDASIVFAKTIEEVFQEFATDPIDYAVLPLRNSISGWIHSSIDGLAKCPYTISAEARLPVKHHLAGFGSLKDARKILTHPHSYKQCKETIDQLIPSAEIIFTDSNIDSAEKLIQKKDKTFVAIIPENAAILYDIPMLQKDIEEDESNETTFILVTKIPSKTFQTAKTAILLFETENIRSNLREILKDNHIDLILMDFIDEHSLYYMEIKGNITDLKIRNFYDKLENKYNIKFLGSYVKSCKQPSS
ncbi:MAG: hypothetical protein KAR79_03705 [Simkaniaceae bacterium]|nr:hypothetical protein [Simkaniaceae bacterium]